MKFIILKLTVVGVTTQDSTDFFGGQCSQPLRTSKHCRFMTYFSSLAGGSSRSQKRTCAEGETFFVFLDVYWDLGTRLSDSDADRRRKKPSTKRRDRLMASKKVEEVEKVPAGVCSNSFKRSKNLRYRLQRPTATATATATVTATAAATATATATAKHHSQQCSQRRSHPRFQSWTERSARGMPRRRPRRDRRMPQAPSPSVLQLGILL